MGFDKPIYQIFVPGMLQTSLLSPDTGKPIWKPTTDVYLSLVQDNMLKKLNIKKNTSIQEWLDAFSGELTSGEFLPPSDRFTDTILRERHSIFTYDWRQSQRVSAEQLILFIEDNVPIGCDIEVIGYSLGGIIAFIALAEAQRRMVGFSRKVRRLITIASPWKGSLLATLAILDVQCFEEQSDHIRRIIHQDNFDSIYELITTTPQLYFFNDRSRPMKKQEFMELFTSHPKINIGKLKRALDFKKYLATLRLDTEIICYHGISIGKQNIYKCEMKDKTLVPFYESNNSDGKLLTYETFPIDNFSFSIRTVTGDHSDLLRTDELSFLLTEDTNLTEFRVKLVDVTRSTISFSLFAQTRDEQYPIKKLSAKKIQLLQQNNTINITSSLVKKKDCVWLTIPSEYQDGCFIFHDATYSFMKQGEKIKQSKNKIVSSFTILNTNVFF